MKKLQLLNQRFDRLLVIAYEGVGPNRHSLWRAICDCGTEVIQEGYKLVKGNTRSCGCMRRENGRARRKDAKRRSWMTVLNTYRARARKLRLDFHLSEDEFFTLLQSECVYCGSPPGNSYSIKSRTCSAEWVKQSTIHYNGIDRRDNRIGYVTSNCVPCCANCNYAKRSLSVDDFMAWVRRLVSFNKEIMDEEQIKLAATNEVSNQDVVESRV